MTQDARHGDGFGSWSLPGELGPGGLVVSRSGDEITATLDGRMVMSMSSPTPDRPAVSSGRVVFDGREYALYAEALGGAPVRCDAFIDGLSLSTREPFADIEQRRKELNFSARVSVAEPPHVRHVSDAELGACSLVGGDRSWPLGMVVAPGLVALGVGMAALTAKSADTPGRLMVLVICWSILAAWTMVQAWATGHTHLLIGQQGMCYSAPLRRVQANWEDTGPARMHEEGGKRRVAIPVRDTGDKWLVIELPRDLDVRSEDVLGLFNLARLGRVGVDVDRDQRIQMAVKADARPRFRAWFGGR